MTISFECSGCGKSYSLKDEAAGKRLRCKQCSTVIQVPEPELEVLDDDDDDLFGDVDEFERSSPADRDDDFGNALPPLSRRASSAPKPKRASKPKKAPRARSHDAAELNFNRITIGLIVGGVMLMFLGLQESRLARAAKTTPQKITLSKLLKDGPGKNAHLVLTGGALSDEFVYESKTNAEPYSQVWVPAVPVHQVAALLAGQKPAVKLIVKSNQCKTDSSIVSLGMQLQTTGLQGMIINKIASLGGEERKLLKESYPSADFDTCYIFQVGRKPAGTGKVMASMFGGGALALVGMALLLGGFLTRPEGMLAMAAAGVLVIGVGGYFSFAGGADAGPDDNAAQVAQNDADANDADDEKDSDALVDAPANTDSPLELAADSVDSSAAGFNKANSNLGNNGGFNPTPRPGVPQHPQSRPTPDNEQKRVVASSGIPVTSTTPLSPGMPLQAKWGGEWYEVRVLEVIPGNKVKIHWLGWGDVWDEEKPRTELQMARGAAASGGNVAGADATPAQQIAQAQGGFRPLDAANGSAVSGPAAGWKVQPDPADVPVAAEAPGKEVRIPLRGGEVTVPELSSDFVAVGNNTNDREFREVWNLREGRKIGVIKGVRLSSEKTALSPDGKHFAGKTAGAAPGLMVWDIAAEKPLGTLPIDSITGFIKLLTFAGTDRLCAGGYDSKLTIWRIPSGDLEHHLEMPKVPNMESVAFSPGGRYLAITHDFNKNLTVFDLDTGQPAGTTTNPSGLSCDGMAFSPDGRELAAVCSDYKGTTIQVWNVSNGSSSATLDLGEVIKQSGSAESKYKGPAIAWFPEQDRWLLYGHAVVDRKLGKRVWSIPGNDQPLAKIGPHNIIGRRHVAVLGGDRQNQAMALIELSEETIAKAAAVVQSGGELADASLPPLTQSDWSQAQSAAIDGRVDWSVAADPAPEPGGTLMKRPISISTRGRQIDGTAISPGPSARLVLQASAAAGAARPTPAAGRPTPASATAGVTELITYDLAGSTELKSFEIPYKGHLLSVSPDGTQAVVRLFDGLNRLDIWNLDEGTHACGWRPYSNEPEADDNTARMLAGLSNTPNFMQHVANIGKNNKQIVLTTAFLDASHLLTLNTGEKLAVWELPACRAVYTVEGVSMGGVSPGGRYLVVFRNQHLQFLDALTGEKQGEVPVNGTPDSIAFHPDGTRMAACVSNTGGAWMNVWNLADGQLVNDFPLPKTASEALHWCGDGHLLLDNSALVDLDRGVLVWSFDLPWGRHLSQSPDGRHWYLVAASGNSAEVQLKAVDMPDKDSIAHLNKLKPQRKCVVEPGSKLSLQVNLAGNPTKPNLAADVTQTLTARFTQNNVTVANGQPVVFKVTSSEKPTGQNVEYRSLGIGAAGTGTTNVAVVRTTVSLEVLQGGKKVWSSGTTIDNAGFGFEHIKQGESIQSHLTKQMHERTAGYLTDFVPPTYIFDDSAATGLGRSQLTATGATHRR